MTDTAAVATTEDWSILCPLTRVKRDGGGVYTREVRVETELGRLCGLSERKRREALLGEEVQRRNAAGHRVISEEALVYCVRGYHRRGDKETAWRIAEEIIDRVAAHVQRKTARWRLSPDEAEDCARDLYAALCEALFDTGPAGEFWEVRFWVCLDRRLLNLLEKRQATRDAERMESEFGGSDGDTESAERNSPLSRMIAEDADPALAAERREALALLTDKERMALYLCDVAGLPEESDDPTRESAARLLGVTGRSIRNYRRRAEEKLRQWAAAGADLGR